MRMSSKLDFYIFFTIRYRKQVTYVMFNLVETDDIERYAWGKDLFNNTFNYLKIALSKRTYDETTKKDIFTYRLYGYPIAFQIWIYESLPSIDGKICQRLFDTWPRFLNWTNTTIRVTAAQLEKIDFDQPDIEVRGIQPNEEERGTVYLVGLFESFSPAPIIDDDSDFVDPPVKIRKSFKATNVENPRTNS
ncbi:Uncharacterized protein Adt_09675 [Abeliophyllum distichum]|uniref:Uncharacterized protein n=1 Tax=Abeliophyllum distichum TaxID=126358 RepID=A0ABD1UHW5_9LAMI